jgi:hypothetical protein|mmetsp:Transcript_40091/g.66777  ORF Transcript_40091/g.66777 Transcript_40091/m.66777 type:complete len:100 (-) Transcript_40091:1770-2069(-)
MLIAFCASPSRIVLILMHQLSDSNCGPHADGCTTNTTPEWQPKEDMGINKTRSKEAQLMCLSGPSAEIKWRLLFTQQHAVAAVMLLLLLLSGGASVLYS